MLDLEKLDNMPMRESMRAHYGWVEYRQYIEWDIAKRILNSHIGKPFDVAYSNFCHKIKPYHDKSVFLNEFNPKWRNINNYYVDNNDPYRSRLFGFLSERLIYVWLKNNVKSIDNFNTQIKLTNAKKNYLTSVNIEQLNKEADLLDKAVLKEKKSYLLVGVVRKIADDSLTGAHSGRRTRA